MDNNSYRTVISLKSVDKSKNSADFYDLATTVLAFGQAVQSIANTQESTKGLNIRIEVEALQPGSLEIPTVITAENAEEIAKAALFAAPLAFNFAKGLLKILSDIINVRKFLKGEKPKKVEVDASGEKPAAIIYNIYGGTMNVDMNTFNAMHDDSVNRNVKKMYEPLGRENSGLESITLIDRELETEKSLPVSKEEVPYLEETSELQQFDNYKVKGIISRLDSKTQKGAITLGSQRVSFELAINPAEYDRMYLYVAESLKMKIPVYVTGKATMDFESNLKKISIEEVVPEARLIERPETQKDNG